MKLTYDPRRNIAYISLRQAPVNGAPQVQTIQLSDELNVDIAPDGSVFGIELLNANTQLSGEGGDVIAFINEASGRTGEIKLAG